MDQAVNKAGTDTRQDIGRDTGRDTEQNSRQETKEATEQDTQQAEMRPSLKLLQMLFSSLAAGFGVQSGKNRQRDFGHGDPKRFIILGIVMTGVFLLTMMGIVKLVLSF